MDWKSFIEGAVAGLAGGVTIKTAIDIRSARRVSRSNTNDSMQRVTQRDNQVGGNMAGRDVNTRK